MEGGGLENLTIQYRNKNIQMGLKRNFGNLFKFLFKYWGVGREKNSFRRGIFFVYGVQRLEEGGSKTTENCGKLFY